MKRKAGRPAAPQQRRFLCCAVVFCVSSFGPNICSSCLVPPYISYNYRPRSLFMGPGPAPGSRAAEVCSLPPPRTLMAALRDRAWLAAREAKATARQQAWVTSYSERTSWLPFLLTPQSNLHAPPSPAPCPVEAPGCLWGAVGFDLGGYHRETGFWSLCEMHNRHGWRATPKASLVHLQEGSGRGGGVSSMADTA